MDATSQDENGHGTHIAGILAAARDNGVRIAGIARVTLVPIRVLDAHSQGSCLNVAQGVLRHLPVPLHPARERNRRFVEWHGDDNPGPRLRNVDGREARRRVVAEVCPRCLMQLRHHIVVQARCLKRWRGANFDAASAQGNVGAAVAGVLGMSVRTSRDLEAFLQKAVVKVYGENLDPNPALEFDTSVGEAYEFHVGLRADLDDIMLKAVEKAAREAVATSRGFALA